MNAPGLTSPVVDAHHHLWRRDAQSWHSSPVLAADFDMLDLVDDLDAAGVTATVLVQSVNTSTENDRLADHAQHPRIAGTVCWLPLADPPTARAEWARITTAGAPRWSAFRCLVDQDPMDWVDRSEVLAFLAEMADRGLAWEVVPVTREQLDAIARVALVLPELRIVIDHLGRPPVETRGWQPWADSMAGLAELPAVAVKVSVGLAVLTAWPEWDSDALDPYVAHLCALFGGRRLMVASNWPVVLLRAPYSGAWRDLTTLIDRHLPDAHSRNSARGTAAVQWYRLPIITDL